MKKIIVLVLCFSMVCCLLAGSTEGVKNPTSETPSNELSPTQEALIKENEEIAKLIKERSSEIDVGSYKDRLIAFDKVDNFYRFEKDSMKDFEIISAGNFLIKNSDGYFAWGSNSFREITTDENKTIKKRVQLDLLNARDYDITKGVVEYFIPSDVEILKTNSTGLDIGITKDGKICRWGRKDQLLLEDISYIEHEDKIVDCFRNSNTVYFITSKGEIFANEIYCGHNSDTMQSVTTTECQKIYKITAEIEAESFCCASSAPNIVIKDKKGDYYIYEYFEYLGKRVFNKLECPEKIADVKTAYKMVYILTEKGNLYCYGENWAQLFEGEKFDKIEMKKLDLGMKAKDFCIAGDGILFTDYNGNLNYIGKMISETYDYTTEEWLYRKYPEEIVTRTPLKIDIPDKVLEFGGNLYSGICKTKNGDVYVWGSNYDGEHLDGTRWTGNKIKITKITK